MAAPPSFLQVFPPETDATDGDIVTFQVKVSNDPDDPSTVSWWRCGESLRPAPGKRDIIEHGDSGWHELVLSNITEEDEGEYECRAENNRGHNSCFGSLYYYREGGTGTLTDVTLEARDGDGRQSGLLILIDDGSQTEESGSEKSNRKSMTVSEQMQGIIEDLTQDTGSQDTGSVTLERDDDQFNSDIDEMNEEDLNNQFIQNILGMTGGQKTASEDTLIPEMPSPDLAVDVAMSEGASDPYGPTSSKKPQKWSSNPNNVQRRKSKETKEKKEEAIWPPEASLVTFDLPRTDTVTTSVELPFARGTSTEEEEAIKSSTRCNAGAETPFDVADITEEAVDAESSLRCLSTEGTTTERAVASKLASSASSRHHPPVDTPSGIDQDSSLTSVTDTISGAAIPLEGCQQSSKMSFVKSTVKTATFKQDDGITSVATSSLTSRVSSTTMDSSSMAVHHRSAKVARTADQLEQEESTETFSYAAKKTKVSSAYEADESTVYSESFLTDIPSEHKPS